MRNIINFILFIFGFTCLCLLLQRMCYEEGMDDGDVDFV